METKGTGLARGQTEKNTSLDVAGLESSAEQVDLRRRVGFCRQARPIQVSSGSMWAMKRFGSFCRKHHVQSCVTAISTWSIKPTFKWETIISDPGVKSF